MKMEMIREQVHAVATKLYYRGFADEAKELRFLAEATRRNLYLRGPCRSLPKISPEMKKWVRILHFDQKLKYDEILEITGLGKQGHNIGRLSEICKGFKR